MDTNSVTYHEIVTQPEAWAGALTAVKTQANALQQLWQSGNYRRVIFTGCGSTYYLSLAAAALWQTHMGILANGVPAGELYLYPQSIYGLEESKQTLLVAISRSGTTTETVAVTQQFQANGRGAVIVITNNEDTPLAQLGDVTIAIPEGREESVAQTRSFASMYVAATAMIMHLAKQDDWLTAMHQLPTVGQALLAEYAPLAQSLGKNLTWDRFYFLGSGPRYGLACEVNLKMKEMTLTHSEPFHFFEFRHGPMSMVNDQTVVIGLLSEAQRSHETAVLQEMAQLGGHILTMAESAADVTFNSRLPASVRNVLYLPVLQLVAYYRAVQKGLNPDQPTHLTAVVELDLQ